MFHVLLSVALAWLFADFLSGVFHWYGDRILKPSQNSFMNSLLADNVLHHDKPAAMLKFSLFQNVRVHLAVMWPIASLLYLLGCPIVIWLGVAFLALANGVHWFSHRRRLPKWILILQKVGIFSSFDHHSAHHMRDRKLIDRGDASEKYCVMTDWVNPTLDRIGFFRRLELALAILCPGVLR